MNVTGPLGQDNTQATALLSRLHTGQAIADIDLRYADLSFLDLYQADLREADLEGVNLTQAILIGADLRGAKLSQAILEGTDLRGADLRGADLKGANLAGAHLHRTDLRQADLRQGKLTDSKLQLALYDNATLWPQGFSYRSSGAVGPRANLNGAFLNTAYLRGVDLQEAKLLGAYLSGADLTQANLRGASLCSLALYYGWSATFNIVGVDLSLHFITSPSTVTFITDGPRLSWGCRL